MPVVGLGFKPRQLALLVSQDLDNDAGEQSSHFSPEPERENTVSLNLLS